MGGEKSGLFPLALNSWGSSPHGRGKALQVSSAQLEHGITPRVGGEKWRNLMNEQKEKGSPPRGRGKVT